MSTLTSTYNDRLIDHAGASFPNLVQIGEWIEDSLKTENINDYQKLFVQSPNGAGSSAKKNFLAGGVTKVKRKSILSLHQLTDTNNHMHLPRPSTRLSHHHRLLQLKRPCTRHHQFTTHCNNNTDPTGQSTNILRSASKIILKIETRTRGIWLLFRNHCPKSLRNYAMPTWVPPKPMTGHCQKTMSKTPAVHTIWILQDMTSRAARP